MKWVILVVALTLLAWSVGLAGDWEVFVNSNYVSTIWAGGDGVLWGSRGGVVSYDPEAGTFEKTVKDVGGLRSNVISAIATDVGGRVWIGTASKGLCVEHGGSWEFHDSRGFHLLSDYVLDIAAYGNTVAVGTSKGLSLFEDGRFVRFLNGNDWSQSGCDSVVAVGVDSSEAVVGTSCGTFALNLETQTWKVLVPTKSAKRIAHNGEGVFWIVAGDSIYTYNGTSVTVVTRRFIAPDVIRDLSARGSTVVVCTNYGPAMYDFANHWWTRIKAGIPDALLDAPRIRVGQDGHLWLGTKDGLGRYDGGVWTIVKSPGPAGNYIQDICIDKTGRVWFMTGYRSAGGPIGADIGILRYDPNAAEPWEHIAYPTIPSDRAYACETDPSDGSIWVGYWANSGALMNYRTATSQWVSYRDSVKNSNRVVSAIYIDQDSNLVFSDYTVGVAIRSRDGRIVRYSWDDPGLCFSENCIVSIGPGPGGSYMLGTYFVSTGDPCEAIVVNLGVGNDLASKTDDFCQVWVPNDGWPQGIATYTFAVDRYGVVWLGSGGGLGAYDPSCGEWHKTKIDVGSVWEVEEDAYGRLWLACDTGLYIVEGHALQWADFRKIQFYDGDNSAMEAVAVKAIEFDADGAVWIGTAGGGIYRYYYAPPEPMPKAKAWIDAYPNPYLAFDDVCGKGIQFNGFKPGSSIRIYTMAGQLVGEMPADGRWDTRNGAGEEMVSGVYLFVGQAEDGTDFKGRLVIVR